VGHHQVEGPQPDEAVPADQFVLPPGAFDEGQPGHQQDLQQQQVGTDQAGEPPDRRQPDATRPELLYAAAGDPQGHDKQQAGPGEYP